MRLRVLAGPNGSGKSSIIKEISRQYSCGYFVNADEIEKGLNSKRNIALENYGIRPSPDDFNEYINSYGKSWKEKALTRNFTISLFFSEDETGCYLNVPGTYNRYPYDAAMAAEFIRLQLKQQRATFTFETVLTHPSKIEFLKECADMGYRNYLYFVCTVSPQINKARVIQRVAEGGHYVPDKDIENRYFKSLDLLSDLIKHCHRVYFFDNSSDDVSKHKDALIAEINPDKELHFHTPKIPWWFQTYLLDKL